MIKESVLRRLSQASPVLSETVRQQRASLSLDMELQKSSEVIAVIIVKVKMKKNWIKSIF